MRPGRDEEAGAARLPGVAGSKSVIGGMHLPPRTHSGRNWNAIARPNPNARNDSRVITGTGGRGTSVEPIVVKCPGGGVPCIAA